MNKVRELISYFAENFPDFHEGHEYFFESLSEKQVIEILKKKEKLVGFIKTLVNNESDLDAALFSLDEILEYYTCGARDYQDFIGLIGLSPQGKVAKVISLSTLLYLGRNKN